MAGRKKSATGQDESPNTRATRVLIVDDHELLRNGMRLMIGNEPDLEICGEAEDEAQAMQQVHQSRPNLAIVDIGLKSGNGIELIKRIKAHAASVRIVVSSMYDERLYGERALRAGADGYVNKQDPARTIIAAIRCVLEGKTYFSEEFTNRMLERARVCGKTFQDSPIDALSDRELEVFRFIGEGLATGEIAKELHLSSSTVDTYRERLKTKLDLKSGTELIHEATQWVLENL
ncbi:MAG: response regulator transcription factor [Planctomycetes bacterium]|nr:response regulator transcription factor [Planctomycetota bacterium]MBL7037850.1 response regulator transcription factor [Pirellulaceae bacterium]